jgi:hypothetical protein
VRRYSVRHEQSKVLRVSYLNVGIWMRYYFGL